MTGPTLGPEAGAFAHITVAQRSTCRHPGPPIWGWQIAASGVRRAVHACGLCGKVVAKGGITNQMMRDDLRSRGLSEDTVLVVQDNRHDRYDSPLRPGFDREPCARCGTTEGVERHHWAPREYFGFDDADTWPTSPLCPSCHREWHRIMTPRTRRLISFEDR